jgi:hypothetical protein
MNSTTQALVPVAAESEPSQDNNDANISLPPFYFISHIN